MREVTVEFGDRELKVSMAEAREWKDAGLAEWLPRRNRMRFTARRDPRPVLRGLSSVAGQAAVLELSGDVARAFVRDQFLKREMAS
jgi:hypothetical protein